jgi:hypothetical protein
MIYFAIASRRLNFLVAASSLAWFVGCSAGSNVAPVDGVATLDGEPVAGAGVVFQPLESGQTASGSTNEQGRFILQTNNQPGVPVGEYVVLITKVGAPPVPEDDQGTVDRVKLAETSQPEPTNYLPARYASIDTSEFRATVNEGENHFNFSMVTDETVTDAPKQEPRDDSTKAH